MSLLFSAVLYVVASLVIVAVLVAVLLAYVVLRSYLVHLHWKRQGLPCAPFIPIVGHMLRGAAYVREDRALDLYRDCTALYGELY